MLIQVGHYLVMLEINHADWSKNIEQGVLVNGSVGKVMEFLTHREALDRHIAIAMPASLRQPPNAPQSEALDLEPPPSLNLQRISNHEFGPKERWPMVRFTNGRELLCAPVAFSVEGFRGNIEAHRLQVPLILAWALSIHKSQGQTLARVKVDLGQIFEKGQGEHSFLKRNMC
jgi:ATP-dependent DNA helicase PIF1